MTNNQSAAAPDADNTRERAMPNIRTIEKASKKHVTATREAPPPPFRRAIEPLIHYEYGKA